MKIYQLYFLFTIQVSSILNYAFFPVSWIYLIPASYLFAIDFFRSLNDFRQLYYSVFFFLQK
jgi:hypothetical protein